MILPDWADERNLKLREGGLLGKIGMGPNLIGVDTPLLAAADSLGSMGAALSVIPGMSAILPQAATYGEAEDKYARALGLFSGMPVSAIELFVGAGSVGTHSRVGRWTMRGWQRQTHDQ